MIRIPPYDPNTTICCMSRGKKDAIINGSAVLLLTDMKRPADRLMEVVFALLAPFHAFSLYLIFIQQCKR